MERQFYSVSASSDYGSREAWYEMIEGVLVLLNTGNHDNLAGNNLVTDFEGLTPDEAEAHAKSLREAPVGHDFDGCHACTWSIGVCADSPPEWLTYTKPELAEKIAQSIRRIRGEREVTTRRRF